MHTLRPDMMLVGKAVERLPRQRIHHGIDRARHVLIDRVERGGLRIALRAQVDDGEAGAAALVHLL